MRITRTSDATSTTTNANRAAAAERRRQAEEARRAEEIGTSTKTIDTSTREARPQQRAGRPTDTALIQRETTRTEELLGAAQRVDTIFNDELKRAPSVSERARYTDALLGGMSEDDVRNDIAGQNDTTSASTGPTATQEADDANAGGKRATQERFEAIQKELTPPTAEDADNVRTLAAEYAKDGYLSDEEADILASKLLFSKETNAIFGPVPELDLEVAEAAMDGLASANYSDAHVEVMQAALTRKVSSTANVVKTDNFDDINRFLGVYSRNAPGSLSAAGEALVKTLPYDAAVTGAADFGKKALSTNGQLLVKGSGSTITASAGDTITIPLHISGNPEGFPLRFGFGGVNSDALKSEYGTAQPTLNTPDADGNIEVVWTQQVYDRESRTFSEVVVGRSTLAPEDDGSYVFNVERTIKSSAKGYVNLFVTVGEDGNTVTQRVDVVGAAA